MQAKAGNATARFRALDLGLFRAVLACPQQAPFDAQDRRTPSCRRKRWVQRQEPLDSARHRPR